MWSDPQFPVDLVTFTEEILKEKLTFFAVAVIISRRLHVFFYKQRFFSTQPQCCLTFSWIELQNWLKCCLIHINIIILRHFYLLYLCPCLDLGLWMLYLCDLFFIFPFIFIMSNRIISWIQTHLFFYLFFGICPMVFG